MKDPDRRLRVVFLIRSLGVGGAERQVALLAAGLHRRGHEVAVLTYYSGGQIAQELSAAGVEVVSLGKRGRWDLLRPFARLVSELRRRRPDILHGYMQDANLLALLGGRLIVRSRVVWGLRASEYEFKHYDWLFRVLFHCTRPFARFADLHIANSKAGRDYHVAQGYPSAKVVVVPNGIDTDRFRPDVERRRKQRAAWGIREGQVLIGLVARLDPMKDHLTFLRAAAGLVRRGMNAAFVCVGDGPDEWAGRLRAEAQALGLDQVLRWEPSVPDLTAAYNALDLLVSCSSSGEGFSNVVGEAMACGVRCVVTQVGDSVDVIGPTGLSVPPNDVEALVTACERTLLVRHPDGRRRIVSEFSAMRLVERTERLLAGRLDGAFGESLGE